MVNITCVLPSSQNFETEYVHYGIQHSDTLSYAEIIEYTFFKYATYHRVCCQQAKHMPEK